MDRKSQSGCASGTTGMPLQRILSSSLQREQVKCSITSSSMFQWIKLSLASFLLVFLLPGLAANTTHPTSSNGLLDAFRSHYEQFHALLVSVHSEETDPFLLRLLGEDLEEFSRIVNQVFVYNFYF